MQYFLAYNQAIQSGIYILIPENWDGKKKIKFPAYTFQGVSRHGVYTTAFHICPLRGATAKQGQYCPIEKALVNTFLQGFEGPEKIILTKHYPITQCKWEFKTEKEFTKYNACFS